MGQPEFFVASSSGIVPRKTKSEKIFRTRMYSARASDSRLRACRIARVGSAVKRSSKFSPHVALKALAASS